MLGRRQARLATGGEARRERGGDEDDRGRTSCSLDPQEHISHGRLGLLSASRREALVSRFWFLWYVSYDPLACRASVEVLPLDVSKHGTSKVKKCVQHFLLMKCDEQSSDLHN